MKHKVLLAVGLLAIQAIVSPFALAKLAQGRQVGEVVGFVVPSQVSDKEPFTFAAHGVVEGEVIQVKTVEGEVVQSKRADKFGRIFLPAGLAAGSYILSAQGGKSTSNIQISPPQAPSSGNGLCVTTVPSAVDTGQGINLKGQGFSGNASDMSLKVGNKPATVLASSPSQIMTGPLPSSTCGANPIEVTNTQTGETSHLGNVLCYELTAKLARKTLVSGEQTTLEFSFRPANFIANVEARITSGPASFQSGGKQKDIQIKNGTGKLPMVADPGGVGPFRVAFDLQGILGTGKLAGETFMPGGVAGGEKKETGDNKKKERCPLMKHIRDEATGWETKEKEVPDPANPGKTKTVYLATRTVRCSIHKSCSKEKGHGGACAFTGKNRCKDHDITETREYATEQERKDGVKDTGVPDSLKDPG